LPNSCTCVLGVCPVYRFYLHLTFDTDSIKMSKMSRYRNKLDFDSRSPGSSSYSYIILMVGPAIAHFVTGALVVMVLSWTPAWSTRCAISMPRTCYKEGSECCALQQLRWALLYGDIISFDRRKRVDTRYVYGLELYTH